MTNMRRWGLLMDKQYNLWLLITLWTEIIKQQYIYWSCDNIVWDLTLTLWTLSTSVKHLNLPVHLRNLFPPTGAAKETGRVFGQWRHQLLTSKSQITESLLSSKRPVVVTILLPLAKGKFLVSCLRCWCVTSVCVCKERSDKLASRLSR